MILRSYLKKQEMILIKYICMIPHSTGVLCAKFMIRQVSCEVKILLSDSMIRQVSIDQNGKKIIQVLCRIYYQISVRFRALRSLGIGLFKTCSMDLSSIPTSPAVMQSWVKFCVMPCHEMSLPLSPAFVGLSVVLFQSTCIA